MANTPSRKKPDHKRDKPQGNVDDGSSHQAMAQERLYPLDFPDV